jgi:hypothetical protein
MLWLIIQYIFNNTYTDARDYEINGKFWLRGSLRVLDLIATLDIKWLAFLENINKIQEKTSMALEDFVIYSVANKWNGYAQKRG